MTGPGPAVAPGASVRLPLAGVTGWEPGDREAIVFWWPPRPGATPEERAAAVRQLVVPIG